MEVVIEAKDVNRELFLAESADLLFHYLILLQAKDCSLADVIEVLNSVISLNNHQMKNVFFLLAFLPSFLFAQTEFTVNGTIAGLPDGAVVRINNVNDNGLVAQTTVAKEKFTVKGAIPEPGLYWITMGKEQAQHVFLESQM